MEVPAFYAWTTPTLPSAVLPFPLVYPRDSPPARQPVSFADGSIVSDDSSSPLSLFGCFGSGGGPFLPTRFNPHKRIKTNWQNLFSSELTGMRKSRWVDTTASNRFHVHPKIRTTSKISSGWFSLPVLLLTDKYTGKKKNRKAIKFYYRNISLYHILKILSRG